ncbi:cation:proton antiporter [Clostridium tagluense]|uniref:cation:proton antiporter n=1 Tax=Clostridium TaxID=1485 RepID=UPI0013E96E29|nr:MULTISPECIES: cation:proton antiporter [Clostridium]MBU3126807.1 cation:proton antiporter [Clostridium tagluense]MBZ9625531.1 cation:proton antiporter [Clostridium sp. FP2]MCB2310483.1 cation:proton antiporter [Clostridium tagluense]MCB2315351.1 cation:proton antiporter [Clostridium tagluense]MCB2320202.1 cation:proton antiporter [Clostridium tagluense]
MAMSLAIIIILGLVFNKLFERLKLPGLLGMLILGVLLGPYGTNIISPDILKISPDLRKIALIIILLRAGLGIKKDTLNKVGVPALKMSCIPGIFEGLSIMFIASYVLGISKIEAGMLGFIIAAVSPAVVVPPMLNFISRGKGEKKGIPTIILAGASIDDVFAITIFSTFLGLYSGKNVNIPMKILDIPISILLGIALGVIVGIILTLIFKKYHMRDTKKTFILIAAAIMLTGVEDVFKEIVPIASLLGVMTIGFILLERYSKVANRLSLKLNKVWVIAEILLFVLVGAQVNIYVAVSSGVLGLIIILLGLVARSIGVLVSLMGTDLNAKERLFCVISYIPKATVQAAMGAVPLAAGVKSGEVILAIAVLSIFITAPLGAIGIKISGEKLLPED